MTRSLATAALLPWLALGGYAGAVRARMGAHWWVLLACIAIVGVLVALGGLMPRDDAAGEPIDLGTTIDTSLAEVSIDDVHADAEGVTIEATITSSLHVPLAVDELFMITDDDGVVSSSSWDVTVDGDLLSTEAQPGVTDAFTMRFDYERAAVGTIRVEVWDSTFVPRDETSFGLFDNFYDPEIVAFVEVPS